MTVNEAIQALTEARDQFGGNAVLKMADGMLLVKFDTSHASGGAIYLCDVPQPSDDEMMEAEARKALRLYGVNPDGMTRGQVYERLEAEGDCDVESVVGAVLGGADYPVRMPAKAGA
jgi:hypothetical protein